MERETIKSVKNITEEQYQELVKLLEQRRKVQAAKLSDKKKLAKAGASLEMKIQSERYHNARIAELTAKIDNI